MFLSSKRLAVAMWAALGVSLEAFAGVSDEPVRFDIGPMALSEALIEWSERTHLDFYFPSDMLRGQQVITSNAVQGFYTAEAALAMLLADTGVTFQSVWPNMIMIRLPEAPDLQAVPSGPVSEVRVVGSRSLNGDIERSPDEAAPYLVLDREIIRRSGATSIVDFLRDVTSAVASNGRSRRDPITGLPEQIDLRGLGDTQTLVLLDGRRLPARSVDGKSLQPNLEAIPLAAVERIEIRQSDGSVLYGAGAAGGVINIVLRHDCEDNRAQVDYGDTFSAGSDYRRAFLAQCMSFNEAHTHAGFSGSVSRDSALSAADRPFLSWGREQIAWRNPLFYSTQNAPPLGAQTNIRSLDGSPLFGPGTPSYTSVPTGYMSADGVAPLHANAGRYSLDLAKSAQMDGGRSYPLRGGLETKFLNWTVTHQFSNVLTGLLDGTWTESRVRTAVSGADFADLSGTVLSANAPNNPFGQDVLVTTPAANADGAMVSHQISRRLTGNLSLELEPWAANLEFTTSRTGLELERPLLNADVAADIGQGALDVMRDVQIDPLDLSPYLQKLYVAPLLTTETSLRLSLEGPATILNRMPMHLRAVMEQRYERFHGESERVADPWFGALASSLAPENRAVSSASTEVEVPLVLPRDVSSLAPLEFEAAARLDRYVTRSEPSAVDAGSTWPAPSTQANFFANSLLAGIRYRPTRALLIRASLGTAYLPPAAGQLSAPISMELPGGALRDESRGGELTSPLHFVAGGNPQLAPERSRTWSAGFVLSLRGFDATLDYIHTSKLNGIFSPTELLFLDPQAFLLQFPERVMRESPSADDAYSIGRIVSIDASNINLSRADVSVWDGRLQYEAPYLRFGAAKLGLYATWQPSLETSASSYEALRNQAGVTENFPLKFAAIADARLTRGSWEVGWSARFLSSYRVSRDVAAIANQGGVRVAGQIYHDVSVGYNANTEALPFEMRFTARNIFNARPPFDAAAQSYFSSFGDPRLAMYRVSFTVHF